ncbi:MAG: FecR family protein [Dyella sp.]|uniref:FecR family protein n=1 Tax=Dyella sp. TaxID=1869338 RepID=UPI003F7FBF2F
MTGPDEMGKVQARALDEAEAWFAQRLSCNEDRQSDFERWLSASPAHVAAWARTCAMWDRLGEMADEGALADFADEALAPRGASQGTRALGLVRATRGRHFRVQRLVAVGLAAGLALGVVMVGVGNYRPQTYAADTSESTVRLPDGTQVHLDVGARLETDIGWWHRNVRLLHGRAVFNVVHNAWRPFVVDVGLARITVLGTRFQVDRERDQLAVTLVRGSVRIKSRVDGLQLRLQPDEQARWSASPGQWTRSKVDAQAATSWTQGFLIFHATPLEQAVTEINRYSQRKMRLADPELGRLQLSGSFHLGDASGVARVLPYVLPVKVHSEGSNIVVSRR